MLTMALMVPGHLNPIEKAVDYYQKVTSYQTIIKSYVGSKSIARISSAITMIRVGRCVWK